MQCHSFSLPFLSGLDVLCDPEVLVFSFSSILHTNILSLAPYISLYTGILKVRSPYTLHTTQSLLHHKIIAKLA